EHGAAREVLEETGLQVDIISLIGIFSEGGHPVVLAAFEGCSIGGEAEAGPEVSDLSFFSLDALPALAFPRDIEILNAWRILRDSGGSGRH
ncbi:NUDIX domain-containing protein, partial [SAR202 cluster bacterium AC-647-N09_OGT_505m]|nr:NUDIX domain-containing protein [SAR202 cluster bacterium AC-647-N09_OGT_505m]